MTTRRGRNLPPPTTPQQMLMVFQELQQQINRLQKLRVAAPTTVSPAQPQAVIPSQTGQVDLAGNTIFSPIYTPTIT